MEATMKYLVTGATGQLGSKVVDVLLESVPPEQVAVSVRDPKKANDLRASGIDVRRGDFDDPGSLATAFAGVERLLMISTSGDNATRLRQHRTAVAEAARAGVRFIAYTSLARTDTSPMALGEVHRATEEAIRATGIAFSFLRNNWYLENESGSIQGAAAGAPILTSAGDGRVGWAARDDFARAAAAVLTGPGHENTVYELSGRPRTYAALAGAIAEVLGRNVPVEQVDDATYERRLTEYGLPPFVVELLVDSLRAMRQGALDVESDDLERLLGRPATALTEVIARILGTARRG